jgi:C4-dicarboxylate-binding protein DctP
MLAPSLRLTPGQCAVRGVRFTVHLPDFAQLHKVTEEQSENSCSKSRIKGIVGLAFWDNGFKDSARTSRSDFRRRQGLEDADSVVEGARCRDSRARRIPGDGVLRGVSGAALYWRGHGTESPPSNFYAEDEWGAKYLTMSDHG